jgi:hypothetical protein
MDWLRFVWSGTTRVPTSMLIAFGLLSVLTLLPDGGGSAAEANSWDGIRGIVFIALMALMVRSFILLRRE